MATSPIELMLGFLDIFFVCVFPFLAIVVALFIGRYLEDSHFRSIHAREEQLRYIPISDLRRSHEAGAPARGATLVTAEVAVSSDYFKTFIAGWISFFGGEIKPYNSLLERARREAILRLKEKAAASGYDAIGNLRLDTVDLQSAQPQRNPVVMVCVMAAGTAYKLPNR